MTIISGVISVFDDDHSSVTGFDDGLRAGAADDLTRDSGTSTFFALVDRALGDALEWCRNLAR